MTGAGSPTRSTRRNGTDNDIYLIDPRDPASNRLLAQVEGGGWGLLDFAPDGKSAVVANYHLGQQDRPLPDRRRQRPDDSDRRP